VNSIIKIGVCYDNHPSAIWIEQLLEDIGKKKLIAIDIDIFCSGEDLCKIIENGIRYDILFIKIEMNWMNGIECAKHIRHIDPDVLLIYISGYETHLMELFEAEPFGFIKSPINPRVFEECFDRAYSKIEKKDIYFEYKFNKTLSKVLMRNILYFESKGRIIQIVLQDKSDKFYGKLNELENQLENSKFSFLRIHQSYLVNYRFIEKIDMTKVRLINGIELQISEDRKKIILEQYRRLVNKN
jgi:DNA-binding LytR/AlgR family response regulator